jgi:hypothetical protein
MLKITAVLRLSGFAVVFAEDIPDIPSTDVPSGECLILSRHEQYVKLSFKMLGLPCVLNIMPLSTEPSEREVSEEMRSMIVCGSASP